MEPTIKKYYENTLLSQCRAKVIEIDEEYIVLDKTISYPEGGGQEGDVGEIILENGTIIPFIDTQKVFGRTIYLEDFPVINVDTEIQHIIEKDLDINSKIKVGDLVTIKININRRELLTISHSASHLLYIGCEEIRPGITQNIIGCHISENSARFDFRTDENFIFEEMSKIIDIANEYVKSNYDIKTYSHKKEKDAIFWECNGKIIPCGGTHLSSTISVGKMNIRRKNIGKGKERLTVTFDDCIIDLEKYHK